MAQFRKSKKVGPFRVTLSQRGISTSVGAGPARISRGADGKTRRTIRAPGTGIYDTKVIGGAPRQQPSARRARRTSTASSVQASASGAVQGRVKPSGGAIFASCVLLLPIWWFFTHHAWFLGLGGLIGVVIFLVQDIGKARQQRQQAIVAAGLAETHRLRAEAQEEDRAAETACAQSASSGPGPASAASVLPSDDDFVAAIAHSGNNIEALNGWFEDPDIGQAARILTAAELVAGGRSSDALDLFESVLAEPPSVGSQEFLANHPVAVTFHAAGLDTQVFLSRTAAAIYAATIYQARGDSANAMEAIEQADDGDLVTVMKSTYAFNTDRFDDVLHITRWVPRPAETSLEAFALILRGCALRETGQPEDALKTLDSAAQQARSVPEVANRLTFELGRTLASTGDYAQARRKYVEVHQADPHFPELEQALAALPTT